MHIETKLKKLLEKQKSKYGVEDIKKIIYNENSTKDLVKIVEMFDVDKDNNEALKVINDAWNYFPHKCLNDLSPAEKISEYQ